MIQDPCALCFFCNVKVRVAAVGGKVSSEEQRNHPTDRPRDVSCQILCVEWGKRSERGKPNMHGSARLIPERKGPQQTFSTELKITTNRRGFTEKRGDEKTSRVHLLPKGKERLITPLSNVVILQKGPEKYAARAWGAVRVNDIGYKETSRDLCQKQERCPKNFSRARAQVFTIERGEPKVKIVRSS